MNLDVTVYDLVESAPNILDAFHEFGIREFDDPAVRAHLGSVLRVRTLLAHRRVDPSAFAACIDGLLPSKQRNRPENEDAALLLENDPTLLALLPCGVKAGLDGALSNFADQMEADGRPFNYRTAGNVNHELSFYPFVDDVTSADELPELILSADLNAFYHADFLSRFAEQGIFEDVLPVMDSAFESIGYRDPRSCFTMFAPNVLVLVRVRDSRRQVPIPESWHDLQKPAYAKSIMMRGQGNFFCSGVLVPFFRLYGAEGLDRLAASVGWGTHPSQMIKRIDSGSDDIPPLYIMPLFFARKIKRTDRVDIIFPDEGAFVSPVQLLVKRSAREKLRFVTDFLMGEKVHQLCTDNHFPSPLPQIENRCVDVEKLFWIGWDFIYENDLGALKRTIGARFSTEFLRTGSLP